MKLSKDMIPEFTFKDIENGEWFDVHTNEIFKNKKVAIFALPGAFTPTCSTSHLPKYEELYEQFQDEGIDEIYCLSVNDVFVMKAWFEELGIKKVKYLADGTGDFTDALGMLVNKDDLGFGDRSWRYSMIVDNGVIVKRFIEEEVAGDPYQTSDAITMLHYLNPEAELPKSHVLITREGCPFCMKAKAFLKANNVPFQEISKNHENINAVILRGLTGNSTYPQLLIEGKVIGGFEEIEKHYS